MLHFVYHIENEASEVIYVGVTNNPNERIHNHFLRSPRLKALYDAGIPLKVKIEETLDDRKQAYERETHWIHHYKNIGMPLMNKVKLPKPPKVRLVSRHAMGEPGVRTTTGFYSIVEAAAYCGVSEKTIQRALRANKLIAHYPNPKRAVISQEDLDAWFTKPVVLTQQEMLLAKIEELASEIASIRQLVDTQSNEIAELQDQQRKQLQGQQRTPPARPAQTPKPKRVATELPDGWIWLHDFADMHQVSRNEADGLWRRGNFRGAKKIGEGRKARVAIDERGQRDAWAQFKALPNFGGCDHCPHSLEQPSL